MPQPKQLISGTRMSINLNKAAYVEKTDTFITAKGIIVFAAIAKKWKDKDKKDDDGQFALTLIYPPDSDLSVLKDDASKAAKEKFGAKTKGLKTPFLKAEDKLEAARMPEGFDPTGWTMLRANTYQKRPNVIFADGSTVPVDDIADECYNGRWARMSVRTHAYTHEINSGVKLYLYNIQLLDDGEKWPFAGGSTNAEDEFSAVETKKDGKPAKAKSSDSVFE